MVMVRSSPKAFSSSLEDSVDIFKRGCKSTSTELSRTCKTCLHSCCQPSLRQSVIAKELSRNTLNPNQHLQQTSQDEDNVLPDAFKLFGESFRIESIANASRAPAAATSPALHPQTKVPSRTERKRERDAKDLESQPEAQNQLEMFMHKQEQHRREQQTDAVAARVEKEAEETSKPKKIPKVSPPVVLQSDAVREMLSDSDDDPLSLDSGEDED